MNYEQKYNEALERAKEQLDGAKVFDYDNEQIAHDIRNTVYNIFPELAESEDERIRKAIHDWLDGRKDYAPKGEYSIRDIIAWLEKQGKQKTVEWRIEDEQNLNSCLGYIPDEYLRRWLKDIIYIKYDKPVDKVEPKFHEGDFIKHNKINIICKVISVNSGSYYVENIETSCRIELFYVEQYFHLWTIEDAKDGDVLVYGDNPNHNHVEVIMLFKSVRNEQSAFTHFHIFIDQFRIDDWCDCGKNVHPATKEQRDLLFAKMKEAGYEWDAEKKELIKL